MILTYPLYFLIFGTSSILASSLWNAKRIEKCSKIVCPPVAATICVKVKERNAQRRYVMMSKCDLKLIKCYGDVITTVVAKKYCNVLRQGEMIGVKEEEPVKDSEVAETPQAEDEENTGEFAEPPKMLQVDNTSQEDPKLVQEQEKQDQENVVEGNSDEKQAEDPDNNDPAEIPKEENPVVTDDQVKEPDLIEIPDSEKNYDDEQKTLQKDEDGAQSGTACPDNCPTRGVMVCARCSHGVYRTFISSCFMRLYQCKHPKEKLELVSRRACTASAPYLGDMPRPKDLLVEPQDGDPVLKHIFDLRDSPAYS